MIQTKWTHTVIRSECDAMDMVHQFNITDHLAGAFDSETTGLRIVSDHPFLFQFGWIDADNTGRTYVVDLEQNENLARRVILAWHRLAKRLPVYLAHNTKFDLHMLTNIGLPYTGDNISDSMFYIRYAHDALSTKNGGPPLKLKEYSARYIDATAKSHEKLLDLEKTEIAKKLNAKLKLRLRRCTPPAKYKAKSYTLKVVEAIFKDPIFTLEDLPEDARLVYLAWLKEDVPDYIKVTGLVDSSNIPYNHLNRDHIITYAAFDIVWVLEIWKKLDPVVTARQNRVGLDIENQLIYPLLEMERVGFKVRKDYLEQCRDNVRNYIIERRALFINLAGEDIKIGQHERVRELIKLKFGYTVETTNSDCLQLLRSELIRDQKAPELVQFIEVLDELRTLEKWYATYIVRFLRNLRDTDRLYTTINQVGTVSGRVTSDFQQFPKDPIKTYDGRELFHPRQMIQVSGGQYNSIAYLDFSQIELRFQAFYTILVGHPDMNLCRAYMPYECVSSEGELFDPTNPAHIRRWREPWYYKESPETLWTPTDVHRATTQAAFDILPSDPDFHRLRYIGKRVNFAKNYGAQYKKICQMFPEYDADRCRKIDTAYYTAFPGVKQYHDYCYRRAIYAYTENLFGIKYYGVSGHKLINILVQGSAAYFLKLKIIELYKYSKEHKLYTRWQMQIHDELSWELDDRADPACVFAFKDIMESWPDAYIPLVAELEVTKTTWAEKEEIGSLDELQIYLGSGPER